MVSVFEWEAPPPRPRGRYSKVNQYAVELANRRGQWAKVHVYDNHKVAHNMATKIRSGKIKGYKVVGKFQAEVRRTAEGYCVYAKCTGYSKAFTEGLDVNNPEHWEVDDESSDS